MRFARNADIRFDKLGDQSNEQRRHGRVVCQDVECSIGEVQDLSASGMRVKTRYKLPDEGNVFVITLITPDGPRFSAASAGSSAAACSCVRRAWNSSTWAPAPSKSFSRWPAALRTTRDR
jgi:hypothetical protein